MAWPLSVASIPAAPAAVVLAAGGVVTALDGSPLWPYDLTNYTGAKVPFVAAGKNAHIGMLDYLNTVQP
jgi:3'-phosphoadenosine 5'-phosphosulfate (PAPS) 3'-phosphatase